MITNANRPDLSGGALNLFRFTIDISTAFLETSAPTIFTVKRNKFRAPASIEALL